MHLAYSSLIAPMNSWEDDSFFGSRYTCPFCPPTNVSVNVSQLDSSEDEIMTLKYISGSLKSSLLIKLIYSQYVFSVVK